MGDLELFIQVSCLYADYTKNDIFVDILNLTLEYNLIYVGMWPFRFFLFFFSFLVQVLCLNVRSLDV